MDIQLKNEYLERIRKELDKNDYNLYLESLKKSSAHGLTINLHKLNNSNIDLNYVKNRFDGTILYQNSNYAYIIYDKEKLAKKGIFPGKDPLYHAGLYYIQEPSAAKVIESVNINPNDIILDLCASPGGKSIQSLYSLDKTKGGFLVSNEINYQRAKVLSHNIERMGFDNIAITCESSKNLTQNFNESFDKVIVDAPCSGEGMMRKSEEARNQWSVALIKSCANIQKELVNDAYYMLKDGGELIYSTCTFSKEEDENVVEFIIDKHKDLKLVMKQKLYPFKCVGEGQFFAIFKKGNENSSFVSKPNTDDFKSLNLIRYGINKFYNEKKGIVPTHESTHIDDIVFDNETELNDEEINRYLRGEVIRKDLVKNGFYKIKYKNLGIGLAKYSNGMLKNHYPKGLRNLK